MNINIDEDCIDVFLLHNNQKILAKGKAPNYYRIISKDIGVKDTFQEIKCKLVNDIVISINIKFRNKYSYPATSIKDRLNIFNQQKEQKNEVAPKKMNVQSFFQTFDEKKKKRLKSE